MSWEDYSGALLEPMPRDRRGPDGRLSDAGIELLEEKLTLLFHHFELEVNDWSALALVLALRHVPGCGEKPRKNTKPERWNQSQLIALARAAARRKTEKPKDSDSAICKWLTKQEPYSNMKVGDRPIVAETLRRKLKEARQANLPYTLGGFGAFVGTEYEQPAAIGSSVSLK